MSQLDFETRDLDEAAAIMRQQYAASTITAPGQTPGLRVRQGSLGGVILADIDYFMDATFTVEELDVTYVARAVTGSMETRIDRHENQWSTGEAALLGGAGATLECSVYDARVEFAVIDPATFQAVAGGADGTPVAFTGDTPLSVAAARNWTRTFTFARQVAAEPDVPALVAGATARLLADTALTTFANNAQIEPSILDRHDAHPATVRQAVAFLETHPHLDLSIVDVAQAAFVTPRALQLAFRRHLEMTPLQYLRRVRLDRAHADLQSASPAVDTVTAIAARWGWVRPSRFTADYVTAYGCHPHQTLQS